jgi:hypothetical protein
MQLNLAPTQPVHWYCIDCQIDAVSHVPYHIAQKGTLATKEWIKHPCGVKWLKLLK